MSRIEWSGTDEIETFVMTDGLYTGSIITVNAEFDANTVRFEVVGQTDNHPRVRAYVGLESPKLAGVGELLGSMIRIEEHDVVDEGFIVEGRPVVLRKSDGIIRRFVIPRGEIEVTTPHTLPIVSRGERVIKPY